MGDHGEGDEVFCIKIFNSTQEGMCSKTSVHQCVQAVVYRCTAVTYHPLLSFLLAAKE